MLPKWDIMFDGHATKIMDLCLNICHQDYEFTLVHLCPVHQPSRELQKPPKAVATLLEPLL
eukprot:1160834-Pelagomonas_calceolata.AAC.2